MVLTAITNAEVAGKEQRELTDDDVVGVLSTEAKKRREAATAFADGGRAEMAAKERAEAAVIADYLPAQLTAERGRRHRHRGHRADRRRRRGHAGHGQGDGRASRRRSRAAPTAPPSPRRYAASSAERSPPDGPAVSAAPPPPSLRHRCRRHRRLRPRRPPRCGGSADAGGGVDQDHGAGHGLAPARPGRCGPRCPRRTPPVGRGGRRPRRSRRRAGWPCAVIRLMPVTDGTVA